MRNKACSFCCGYTLSYNGFCDKCHFNYRNENANFYYLILIYSSVIKNNIGFLFVPNDIKTFLKYSFNVPTRENEENQNEKALTSIDNFISLGLELSKIKLKDYDLLLCALALDSFDFQIANNNVGSLQKTSVNLLSSSPFSRLLILESFHVEEIIHHAERLQKIKNSLEKDKK